MSYYIQNDGRLGAQVASNSGWGEFGNWADSISDNFPEIAHLFDSGWCDNPAALLLQLSSAPTPSEKETAGVLSNLIDLVRSGDAKIVVSITDGLNG